MIRSLCASLERNIWRKLFKPAKSSLWLALIRQRGIHSEGTGSSNRGGGGHSRNTPGLDSNMTYSHAATMALPEIQGCTVAGDYGSFSCSTAIPGTRSCRPPYLQDGHHYHRTMSLARKSNFFAILQAVLGVPLQRKCSSVFSVP